MVFCCCFGSQRRQPTRRRSKRRQRAAAAAAEALTGGIANSKDAGLASGSPAGVQSYVGPYEPCSSAVGISRRHSDDYQSCQENFSVIDGFSPCHSAHGSPPGTPKRYSSSRAAHMLQGASFKDRGQGSGTLATVNAAGSPAAAAPATSPSQRQSYAGHDEASVYGDSVSGSEDASCSSDNPVDRVKIGCLTLLENLSMAPHRTSSSPHSHQERRHHFPDGGKPNAGCSVKARDFATPLSELEHCCECGDQSPVNIRSLDYMRTKVKVRSAPAIYKLAAVDVFGFPSKQSHIAQLVNLPPVAAQPAVPTSPSDVQLPPLLIFNMKIPLYQPSLFGTYDGPGLSVVHYFRLPEGFNAAAVENQKALGLVKRFVANGREADGTPTRDRLKLIPRILNVDEWVRKGPLSSAEHKLLVNYNEKPVLTRPQQEFYRGRDYLEVDMDIHAYNFMARKAIMSYLQRLSHVIWENAFVIQGNSPDELPEQVLGCSRVYRFDFTKVRQYTSFLQAAQQAGAPGSSIARGFTFGEAAVAATEAAASAAAAAATATAAEADGTEQAQQQQQ